MGNRLLVAVDISNLFHCVGKRFNGRRLDYSKLLKVVVGPKDKFRALAFGSEMPQNSMADFKYALQQLGFELRFMTPKVYPGKGQGREVRKADWDVGITVEIIENINEFDTLILVSADGDMADCVRYVQRRGKRCVIYGSGISRDLKAIANEWTEVHEGLLE